MTQLVTLSDNSNFAQLAAAMGMSADVKKETKSNTLARLKIDHSGVMGEEEIKGKMKKVQVVDAGQFCLSVPHGDTETKYYCATPQLRLFNQRFMYKRYIKQGEKGRYVKTVMATDLKNDLRDNEGGFNCGKPSGWIEDYKALPDDMKNLLKSIKRVRVLFGTINMDSITNHLGASVDSVENIPFIWEVDNKDAFKEMGAPITQLAKQNRLLPQHYINLTTSENPLPNGSSFWTPNAALDLSTTLPLTDADQKIFADFNEWIDGYNEYILKAYNEAAKEKQDAEFDEVVEEFVDVETA
jgi:hypothetical protein